MKRRRPVLELHTNSTFPKSPGSATSSTSVITQGLQSLVSYSEDSDSECNAVNLQFGDTQKPVTAWQVCVDENTGYTYYWNIETNQVTWEIPAEYLAYEVALQQYNVNHVQSQNGVDGANLTNDTWNSATTNVTSKSSSDNKSSKNGKELFPAYGPLLQDELTFEEMEAKKMACARKRLLSYKSDKLKPKIEETMDKVPVIVPQTVAVTKATVTLQKTDVKIPFIPTAEEIKEHPIFSNSSALSVNPTNLNSSDYMNGVGGVSCIRPANDESQSTSLQKTNPATSGTVNENKRLTIIAENYSDSDEDEDDEHEDLDDVIINRLRKKALLLKELGGDVPKEIVSVLDQSKTAEDIIAEIEKEIPPDLNEEELPPVPGTETLESTSSVKPLFPITDYAKTVENEETKSNTRPAPANQKTKMKNVQKIKLSARARELIKTSLLTAKARATNFVETEDGLKPAEEVAKMNENKAEAHSDKKDIAACNAESEITEQKRRVDELEKLKAEIDKLSSVNNVEQETTSVANSESDSKTSSSNSECPIKASTDLSEPSDKSKEDMYSFQKSFVILNPKRPKVLDDIETQESCVANPATVNPSTNLSLVTKCEEFLQSVKKNVTESSSIQAGAKKTKSVVEEPEKMPATTNAFSDIDIDEVLNTKNKDAEKNTVDLAQLVMEKLKFLSDGKGTVADVQVMAIQIETLVGAWQKGALTLQYLSDWLDASAVHLKRIEEAAAPEGWLCEWDSWFIRESVKSAANNEEWIDRAIRWFCSGNLRSYGRYYYRDRATGTIQWDFPEAEEDVILSVGKKEFSKKTESLIRPRTPPPPVISNGMVPPPPPIISAHDSRKRRTSPTDESANADVKRKSIARPDGLGNQIFSAGTTTVPSIKPLPALVTAAPPLPAMPPKPVTPPPPPPSSPPPPPPPPPVISSPVSISNEVNQNLNQLEKCESANSNSDAIHEVLDSFYSDIASIEATFSSNSNDAVEETATSPVVGEQNEKKEIDNVPSPKVEEKVVKKKKKVKLDSSLSLKKKGLQGLVAKWQKVSSDI